MTLACLVTWQPTLHPRRSLFYSSIYLFYRGRSLCGCNAIFTVVKTGHKRGLRVTTDKRNFECFEGLSGSESSPAATRAMSMIKTDEASAACCQQTKDFPHKMCYHVSLFHSRHPHLALQLREASPLQVT